MFTDGYENYCSELVDNATGRAIAAREDLCVCEEFPHTSKGLATHCCTNTIENAQF